MGLAGGPHGAKAVFQQQFPDAFKSVDALSDVRELVGVARHETLAVLDGNVMMSGVPTSVDTFNGYVRVMSYQVRAAFAAAAHVVLVFDEPKSVSFAKHAEQQRRDAQRRPKDVVCSTDLVAGITDDKFTTDMLQADGFNAKILMSHRPARGRFFDAVCVAMLRKFEGCAFANNDPSDSWSLTFDGIDARGAERGYDEPRVPGVLSNHQPFWSELLARPSPMGEGDLKLTDVTQRVHDSSKQPGSLVAGVVLNLVVTIDTDSFALELMQQERRTKREDEADRNELTILCFKERASKRKNGDEEGTAGHFLCCDMEILHEEMFKYFYGTTQVQPKIVAQQPAAMALVAAALASCGCDFVKIDGLRVDLALPIVRDVVRNHHDILDLFANVRSGDPEQLLLATEGLEFLIEEYIQSIEGMPRMKKSQASAQATCNAQLLRVLWTCAYWHLVEYKNCTNWGFVAASG